MSFTKTAIDLWENMTGSKVDSCSFSGSINQSFSIYSANQQIQRAKDLNDDVAVTLVIRHLLADYAQSVSFQFTLAEILDGVANDFESMAKPAHELRTFLDTDKIRDSHDAFFQDCYEALAHYRQHPVPGTSEQTHAFVEHKSGLVGLDAYGDLAKLTKLTMFDGEPAGDETPKVNHLIFSFETLEELIDHGASIPSGFSLCAITSKHISDSYFVLVVRNGGRVIIVTDKGNYTHPLQQSKMRNRNDRYNLDRIDSSRFPYDLLNIKWSDNGRRAEHGEGGQALMSNNTGFRVLGGIKDLDDWDLLWFHLFVQQCRQRYFVDGVTEPVMATGSMIRLPHRWAGKEKFPVPANQRFGIETRTSTELSTEFLHTIEPAWKEQASANGWMEDRFADQVPDDCLYIPASGLAEEGIVPLLTNEGGKVVVSPVNTTDMDFMDKNRLNNIDLKPIDPFSLATKERVVRDAHFMARHNQSKVIENLVKADYKTREREVIQWFNQAVADHLPTFIDELMALNHRYFFVRSESFESVVKGLKGREGFAGMGTRIGNRRREISVSYEPIAKQWVYSRSQETATPKLKHLLGLVDFVGQHHLCYFDDDEPAQIFLRLLVGNVADIMKLTGLALDQIPPELHSRGINVYTGNSILDRIDPMATLHNPWDKLQLHFSLPVSLKTFKSWRKERGLDTPKAKELEDWSKQQAREAWAEKNASEEKGDSDE